MAIAGACPCAPRKPHQSRHHHTAEVAVDALAAWARAGSRVVGTAQRGPSAWGGVEDLGHPVELPWAEEASKVAAVLGRSWAGALCCVPVTACIRQDLMRT